jgi:hypothetical protein
VRTIGGLRYDDPRATPEYITRERARKRLANRDQWVRKNWPRVEAQVKGNEMARNEDGSVKDDGTLYGYYESRRENRLERERLEREAKEKEKEEKK